MNIEDINGLEEELASKAEAVHTHPTSDITGLVAALANKAPLDHTHDITDFPDFTATAENFSVVGHQHVLSDVAGLNSALSGKSDSGHTHTTSQVTGLDEALSERAPVQHTHPISDIIGLGDVNDPFAFQSDWGETSQSSPSFIHNKPLLGNAASKNVGTGAADVAAGNHTHSAAQIQSGTISVDRLPTFTSNRVLLSDNTNGAMSALNSAGTTGQVLTSNGTSTPPTWQTPSFSASNLPASAVSSGTFDIARIPTGSTSSTVALGNHTHSQYVEANSNVFLRVDSSQSITEIRRMTYDSFFSLTPKSPTTLYIIVG